MRGILSVRIGERQVMEQQLSPTCCRAIASLWQHAFSLLAQCLYGVAHIAPKANMAGLSVGLQVLAVVHTENGTAQRFIAQQLIARVGK